MATEYIYFRNRKDYISFLSATLDESTNVYKWDTPVANDADAILLKFTSDNYTITDETTSLTTLKFTKEQQEAIVYWVKSLLIEDKDPKMAIWYRKQFAKKLSTNRANVYGGSPPPLPKKPYSAK